MIYALVAIIAGWFSWINWGDSIHLPGGTTNATEKEAKYTHNVKKAEEKEKYERRLLETVPAGYMTVDEYEEQSVAKDKAEEKVGIPKVEKGSDMIYVPQPTYKMVRYNNPPGSPEISIKPEFYKKRQQNAQGIVSPDYKKLVYPAVYYYPNGSSVSTDLFVIPLDEGETNLNRVMKANVIHKQPDAILSTDKTIDNDYTFRTLTPVDFSADGSMLLAKEKVGSYTDGIWKTTPIVYHFETDTSYRLIEVRDAIIYYWRENKNLDLDDKRWDVYPLGFELNNPDRIIIHALAYTGKDPINLGLWSVDTKGEQSRLITFNLADVPVAMNGLKLVQDGVVPKEITENEEKALKKIEKADEKEKEKALKEQEKALKDEYKQIIKNMDNEYKLDKKYYDARQKIQGSTSDPTAIDEKYQQAKEKIDAQVQKQQEKQELREIKYTEKLQQKEEKQLQLKEKLQLKTEQELEKELEQIRSLPLPEPIPFNESIFND